MSKMSNLLELPEGYAYAFLSTPEQRAAREAELAALLDEIASWGPRPPGGWMENRKRTA